MPPTLPIALLLTSLGLVGSPAARAQPADTLPRGAVIEKVACAADPSQSYAVFLPSSYTPEQKWPIVYAFDPVARGSVPVQQLSELAERYGFIVAGSNNSRNGPRRPQLHAAQTMMDDTQRRFALDMRRFYATGFSGGARVAAMFALSCGECIAGVIAHGAGLPVPDSAAPANVRFAFFAAVGDLDFNYPELVRLEAAFRRIQVPFHLHRFPGPHQWAPKEVWEEAWTWMEVLAMKQGRGPTDQSRLKEALEQAGRRARAREDAGDFYLALIEYRKMVSSFDGLADVRPFEAKVAGLRNLPAVRTAEKREKEGILEQETVSGALIIHMLDLEREAVNRNENLRTLKVKLKGLQEELSRAKEPWRAIPKRRALVQVFAIAYELAEGALRAKDFSLALAYFEVTAALAPDSPDVLFQFARTHALRGERKQALAFLERAVQQGFRDSQRLLESDDFAALREDETFKRILASIPPGP